MMVVVKRFPHIWSQNWMTPGWHDFWLATMCSGTGVPTLWFTSFIRAALSLLRNVDVDHVHANPLRSLIHEFSCEMDRQKQLWIQKKNIASFCFGTWKICVDTKPQALASPHCSYLVLRQWAQTNCAQTNQSMQRCPHALQQLHCF